MDDIYILYVRKDWTGILRTEWEDQFVYNKSLGKVRQDSPQEMQNLQDILELVIRKTAHMTEYAILFLLSYLATVKISMSQSRFYNRSIAVLISLLYACSDEMHQLLVPGRSGK